MFLYSLLCMYTRYVSVYYHSLCLLSRLHLCRCPVIRDQSCSCLTVDQATPQRVRPYVTSRPLGYYILATRIKRQHRWRSCTDQWESLTAHRKNGQPTRRGLNSISPQTMLTHPRSSEPSYLARHTDSSTVWWHLISPAAAHSRSSSASSVTISTPSPRPAVSSLSCVSAARARWWQRLWRGYGS